MELRPNLHMIPGLFGNVFLCIDDQELTLIDTGITGKKELLYRYIRKLGFDPHSAIKQIVITHADFDHAGNVAAIQKDSGCIVYAGAATADYLSTAEPPPHVPQLLLKLMQWRYKMTPVPNSGIEVVAAGETIPVWGDLRVLAAPGHTAGHHAFFSRREGVLFAGDALQTIGGRIGLLPKLITGDWEAAQKTAVKLLSLSPAMLACGHGRPSSSHSSDDIMALFFKLKEALQTNTY